MDDGGSPTTGMKKLSNRLMKLFGVDTDDVTEEEIRKARTGFGITESWEPVRVSGTKDSAYYGAPQEYHCH